MTYFLKYFWNKHLFNELKQTFITNFAALVTHKTSRHSYPLALLILSYHFSIFSVFVSYIDGLYCYDCNTYAKLKVLRKMQIWLKTFILMGKSSKMAPNSEQLSPEWNKFQEP